MCRILLVEDDKYIRIGITELLSAAGHTVAEAPNGEEALHSIENEIPDLVISDIVMPIMDGIEFYKEFRTYSFGIYIPFIFLSAKMSHDDVRIGMNLGVDDYIIKPFTANELLTAVENKLYKTKDLRNYLFEIIARRIQHELRTPLVGSLGYSEIIIDHLNSLSNEDLIEMLSHVRESNRRLLEVIGNIMYDPGNKFLKKC